MTTNKQKVAVKAYQKFGWQILDEWLSCNKTTLVRWNEETRKYDQIDIDGQGRSRPTKK